MYNALVMSTIDYYDNRRLQRKLHIMPLWHFINLHYRWHENTASQLLADGRKICYFSLSSWRVAHHAVGRKNFLFHDTVKGAQASSIIYSLVETAKLNNLNIYAYLETVLLYMPDYKNESEGIEELMPWSEMIQQRCQLKSKSWSWSILH